MANIQDEINKIADKLLPMEKYKELGEYETMINNTPDDIVCKKCGYSGVYVREYQTRSSDETGTKVFVCLKCHYKWRQM